MPMLKFSDWSLQQSQSFSSQFPWQRMWHACSFYWGREANPFHFHCSKMLPPWIYSQCLIGKHYINANRSLFFNCRSDNFSGKMFALHNTVLFETCMHRKKCKCLVLSYHCNNSSSCSSKSTDEQMECHVELYCKNTSQHTLVFSLGI